MTTAIIAGFGIFELGDFDGDKALKAGEEIGGEL